MAVFADWASRVAFVVAWIAGWVIFGPPWMPSTATAIQNAGLASDLTPIVAFIVAALVQRVILADYALKAGPFELTRVEKVTTKLTEVVTTLSDKVEASDIAVATELAGVKTGVDALRRQVAELKQADKDGAVALEAVVTIARRLRGRVAELEKKV
jgi:hypothetical protein